MMQHSEHIKTEFKYLGCPDCLKDDPRFTKCPLCDKYIINHPRNIDAELDRHIKENDQ